jgi:WD40 repeat protein
MTSSLGGRKSNTGKNRRLVGKVPAHASGLTHITWSTDGKHVLTGGCDGGVSIAVAPSVETEAKTICSINDHEEAVTALAVSPSGKHFASAAEDHIVKLYTYPGGHLFQALSEVAQS